MDDRWICSFCYGLGELVVVDPSVFTTSTTESEVHGTITWKTVRCPSGHLIFTVADKGALDLGRPRGDD